MAFAGIPEFIECSERGETLFVVSRELNVCVLEAPVTRVADATEEHRDGSATQLTQNCFNPVSLESAMLLREHLC
jgi:hypothetical protein